MHGKMKCKSAISKEESCEYEYILNKMCKFSFVYLGCQMYFFFWYKKCTKCDIWKDADLTAKCTSKC